MSLREHNFGNGLPVKYAFFELKTVWHKDLHSINWANRFNVFPLSLGKLISKHELQELHFSLTKGVWKHQRWGYAIREAPPNAQLWLWFQHFHKNPQKAWRDITSELSGQFCSSINFIDNSATVQPKYSLRPEGVIDGNSLRNGSIFYGALPHESVCTENLTPWKKLLPCFATKGLATLLNAAHLFNSYYFSLAVDFRPIWLATLLNAAHLFNSYYFSLAVDFRPICRDIHCESTSVELIQSISVVFNPPVMFDGKQSWSLVKLFGTTLTSTCSLAAKTTLYIDLTDTNSKNASKLTPEPTKLVYSVIGAEERSKLNLTPWKKLLPCFATKGLATLLNAAHLFNSYYFSLAVDFRPICRDIHCESTSVELIQSISVVFNPPVMFDGKQSWSLVKLFGTTLTSTCSLAAKTTLYIDLTDTNKFLRRFDCGQYFQDNFVYTNVKPPPLYANRFIKGYGLADGGITCHIFNNLDKPIEIVYLDVIPWYLRMYLHTLKITANSKSIKPHTIYYKPSKDRIQSHHLELLLVLPPNSMTDISYQFDRVFLKWTEYPPDANHGVYVNSAII
ncbi:unnamed protein product, partial [Oppiella nova]